MNVTKSPKKRLKVKYRYFHLGNVLACLGGNKSLLVVPGTPTVRSPDVPLDKGHIFPPILRADVVFEVIIRNSRTAIEFPTAVLPLPPEPVLFDPTRLSGGHDDTVDAFVTLAEFESETDVEDNPAEETLFPRPPPKRNPIPIPREAP